MPAALAYLTQFHPGFWIALGGVLGAVAGSFLNCACHRLPRGLSLRRPAHSFCPACKHKLAVPDLVPMLSWLALGGRCRYCRAAIGARSLWLEVCATGAGAALAFIALHL